MMFSAREDLEAPVEFVFDALSDFDGYERAALRRGAEVTRIDRMLQAGPGMTWRAVFTFRGRPRRMNIVLQAFERPTLLRFDGESKNLEGELAVEIVALSPRRSRVGVKLEVRPTTLAARIMLQSLRLARGRLVTRFKERVRNQATEIEERWKRGGA